MGILAFQGLGRTGGKSITPRFALVREIHGHYSIEQENTARCNYAEEYRTKTKKIRLVVVWVKRWFPLSRLSPSTGIFRLLW